MDYKKYPVGTRVIFNSLTRFPNPLEGRKGRVVGYDSGTGYDHRVDFDGESANLTVAGDELTSIKMWWLSRVVLGLVILFVVAVIAAVVIGLFVTPL